MFNVKNMGLTALSTVLMTTAMAVTAHASDYLSFNLGYYDIFRKDQKAAQFGLEYRFTPWEYGIRPIVGGFVTSEGSSYAYAGANWDVALMPNQLYLVPNFAVGAYSDGGGKDLGGVLEFRSGIEVDYQLPNTQQVGVALNHISNAGIYSHNPGEETVMINYSIPVGTLLR